MTAGNNSKSENISLNVKVLKKRGRKPKNIGLENILKPDSNPKDTPKSNDSNQVELKVPKKRGRKPKNNKKDTEVKVPKKRGRKPMLSQVVLTNKNLNENFITKDNVLHLKINSQEAENNIMLDSLYQYNPEINEPQPYDPVENYAKTLENLESSLKSKYDNHNYLVDSNQESINTEMKEQESSNINFVDNKNMIGTKKENTVDNSQLDKNSNNNNNNNNNESILDNLNPEEGDFTNNTENLNISQEELLTDNGDIMNYDDILKSQENISKSIEDNMNTKGKLKSHTRKKVNSIMVFYNEYNKRKEWPKKSSINCFWCCHSFNTVPCALPTKLKGDVFHVYGNFCSKECAASYNFESFDTNNSQSSWERYSLLNHLYSIIEGNPELKINLAPHRMTLEMFGGSLSIDEFRESFATSKKYNVVFPPMVSIIPALEETNKVDNSKRNESYYIPIDKERIKKVNNDLRLKRRNPINNKNTLENCMRLKYT